ncbi:hypothetical protein ACKX2L_08970 [Lachnospiraceae bacterium YH-ros2228]
MEKKKTISRWMGGLHDEENEEIFWISDGDDFDFWHFDRLRFEIGKQGYLGNGNQCDLPSL